VLASESEEELQSDPDAYRIVGVVNHLGVSSDSGHYISDVCDLRKRTWSSYDDTKVTSIDESEVLARRVKTGYIFFYIHK
jgi:ubiquitin carboxyl-terminal hydrolase 26/29/37